MALPLLATLAISGLGALGGALANRKQTQTSMPLLSPADEGLSGILRNRLQSRLLSPTALPAGFESSGIASINETFNPLEEALNARLTSRGLGTSPVAGAGETALQTARGSEIARFLTGLPLLERQMQNEDLGFAESFLRSRTGQQFTTPGNKLGGAVSSAASILAFLAGMGQFGKGKPESFSF